MDNQNADKQQELALLDAPGEFNAMRALLLGICKDLDGGLGKAASYNDLLEDELEMRGGNVDYLRQMRQELERMRRLVARVLQETPLMGRGERLNLSLLASGVLDRYRRDVGEAARLEERLEDGLLVRGDAFSLQELLLDVLHQLGGEGAPRAWQVATRQRNLSAAEHRQLHAGETGEGAEIGAMEVVELSILPPGAELPTPRELRPFRDAPLAQSEAGALLAAKWNGAACGNGGRLYYSERFPEQSAVLFFPVLKEWDGEADEMDRYRWDNAAEAKTILLVDDEDMIWDVLMDMLQTLGYQVILAGDGKEAVEIYGANPGKIDLVILDMLMPNMGGRETFFILKELDPKVRVLASSGYVSEDAIQDIMDSGAAGFLRKPYRLADLARKIREIFAKA